jgi:hypothetical protein
MTFESSYENYISRNYTAIDWTPIDPRKIWHIIYQVPEDQAVAVAKLATENKAALIHITPAVMPNPYNSLPSESYMDKIINFVPGGSPLVQDHLSSDNGGSAPRKPSAKVTNLDYTSLHVEWAHPGGDPYGFAVYAGGEELVRLPGFMRKVTIGNLPVGRGSMAVTIKAIGAGGQMGAVCYFKASPNANLEMTFRLTSSSGEKRLLKGLETIRTPATTTPSRIALGVEMKYSTTMWTSWRRHSSFSDRTASTHCKRSIHTYFWRRTGSTSGALYPGSSTACSHKCTAT